MLNIFILFTSLNDLRIYFFSAQISLPVRKKVDPAKRTQSQFAGRMGSGVVRPVSRRKSWESVSLVSCRGVAVNFNFDATHR